MSRSEKTDWAEVEEIGVTKLWKSGALVLEPKIQMLSVALDSADSGELSELDSAEEVLPVPELNVAKPWNLQL